MNSQWLISRRADLLFIFFPISIVWLICGLLPESIIYQPLSLWVWVLIVLGIDVSHVWSTLFRTYLNREEYENHRGILIFLPLALFCILLILSLYSHSVFWRILAYVALIHFIKQQIGFTVFYNVKYYRAHKHPKRIFLEKLDKKIIYLATCYPVFYWHLNDDRMFSWFAENDFFSFRNYLESFGLGAEFIMNSNHLMNFLYGAAMILYFLYQIYTARKYSFLIPWGKLFWVMGTAVNWYLGIVHYNSDLIFTLTNVVAHGLPYFVLIYYYQIQKIRLKSYSHHKQKTNLNKSKVLILVVSIPLFLAFFEEYLWDLLVYRENNLFFEWFLHYPFAFINNYFWTSLFLATLSLPQVTHYILDGILWKNNKKNPYLKGIFL